MPQEKNSRKLIAENRKARHDYFVEERYEAGIALYGTEVKSVRAGQVNLKDSYCIAKNGEIYIHGMHISPYEKGSYFNTDPLRPKKLLMHKAEIRKKRLHFGLVFQNFNLFPQYTVLGNVMLAKELLEKGINLLELTEDDKFYIKK